MKVLSLSILMVLVILLCTVDSHRRQHFQYYQPYRRMILDILQTRYPWLPQYIFPNRIPYQGFIRYPSYVDAANIQRWGQIISNAGIQHPFVPIRQEFVQTRDLLQPRRNNTTSCQASGCRSGDECVFSDRWVCPKWIPYLNCRCLPGCRFQNTFIPFGKALVIDKCGNRCSCMSIYGTPECHFESC